DVVSGVAPFARKCAAVDVRARAAEQVTVPEEDPHARTLVMCPVTLRASWVASTKRCKDAGSVHRLPTDATEDAAARRVIAGQGAGERCRAHHLGQVEVERVQELDRGVRGVHGG